VGSSIGKKAGGLPEFSDMKFEIVYSKCRPDRLAISPDPTVGENEFHAAVREMAKSEVLHPALKFSLDEGDILIDGVRENGPVNPQQIAAIGAFMEAAISAIARQESLDARLHDELVTLFSHSSGLDIKSGS